MYNIVVARYNEDIEWTKQFQNVIIYNKGEKLQDENINEVKLPNVGKEGHTYYTHICENYDKLEDYTIFVQGSPFEHSPPNVIEHLHYLINFQFLNTEFQFLNKDFYVCNLNGCIQHLNLPIRETYEKLFDDRKEVDFYFGAGAQFIVSKKQILKRPKSFYARIVDMLSHEINPLEGFVIERFHQHIFQ